MAAGRRRAPRIPVTAIRPAPASSRLHGTRPPRGTTGAAVAPVYRRRFVTQLTDRRADIQGLRAVAVLAVLANHAGLPLPGGFAGVDVFFVISGYVITEMLGREWSRTGTIDLPAFYRRRLLRLVPAAAGVLLFTAAIGPLLLLPFGRAQDTFATGLGASVFAANAVIAASATDYFGPPTVGNPLVHVWSLSVEEQFYAVFPALLLAALAAARRSAGRIARRRALLGVVAAASAASLATLWLPTSGPEWLVGYYTPVNRAWEFGAGALVALTAGRWRRLGRRTRLAMEVAGAALLVASLVGIQPWLRFPGPVTCLPVLAAALLLGSGVAGTGPVGWTLARRPLVRVGDLSYSLYLWHWPLIVVAGVLLPGGPVVGVAAALVSTLPAAWSYRVLERPYRGVRAPDRRVWRRLAPFIAGPALAMSLALALSTQVVLPALRTGLLPAANPLPPFARDYPAWATVGGPCPQEGLRPLFVRDGLCRETRPGLPLTLAVIGDSHAGHLLPGFAERAPSTNVGIYDLADDVVFRSAQTSAALADALAAEPSLRTVVVSLYWHAKDPVHRADNRTNLALIVHTLRQAGKRVYLYDDVPWFDFPGNQCIYRIAPVIAASRCDREAGPFWADQAPIDDVLGGIAAAEGATLVPTARLLCPGERCSMVLGGQVGYSDSNHLNALGSVVLYDRVTAEFPDLMGG